MTIARIPFCGFYNSLHEGNIDYAIDSLAQNDDGDIDDDLRQRIFDAIDFKVLFFKYAQEFARDFLEKFNIKGGFESLSSPREYNFETDKIFIDIPAGEIARMYAEVDKGELRNIVRLMFTSRSGFISFYSNDLDDWGTVDEWDHNQLFALIHAYGGDYEEEEIVESWTGNGILENWILENPAVLEVVNNG